jgi:hypothetical protein
LALLGLIVCGGGGEVPGADRGGGVHDDSSTRSPVVLSDLIDGVAVGERSFELSRRPRSMDQSLSIYESIDPTSGLGPGLDLGP